MKQSTPNAANRRIGQPGNRFRSAFTLIELLIVIAIIGILTAVLVPAMSGGTASARAARCLTNMRNLGAAVQTYGMANADHWYPQALSHEYHDISLSNSGSRQGQKPQICYNESRGWVSWYSQGVYSHGDKSTWPTSSRAGSCRQISAYSQNRDEREYALTNGVLWKYVGENSDVYWCPEHRRKMPKLNPAWSYVMNVFFMGKYFGSLKRADRYLLFAELPFSGIGTTPNTSSGESTDCDCALQYRDCGRTGAGESLGVNHKIGQQTFAHVCFADGHCEKLEYPKGGLSEGELQQLTEWLCKGIDVSYDGKQYKNLTNVD